MGMQQPTDSPCVRGAYGPRRIKEAVSQCAQGPSKGSTAALRLKQEHPT